MSDPVLYKLMVVSLRILNLYYPIFKASALYNKKTNYAVKRNKSLCFSFTRGFQRIYKTPKRAITTSLAQLVLDTNT